MKKPMSNPPIAIPEHIMPLGMEWVSANFDTDIQTLARAVQSDPRIDERDITIMVLRSGMLDSRAHTLTGVAKYAGISKSRTLQLEYQLFARIRSALRSIS